MTDKEKILAKIELLLNETNYEPFTDEVLGRIKTLNELKSYIDSLQEEPVNEDLDEAANNTLSNVLNTHEIINVRSCLEMFRFGAEWQKEQDKETIELAEDHAMFAGIIKGTEHTIGNVRSILNKVAYKNNGLDVNGDYCEQPYVELDNEFRKLLKEE